MPSAAYERARKLWTPRRASVTRAHVLGVVHSLLLLALLGIGGLLIALVDSRGETWATTGSLPSWISAPPSTAIGDRLLVSDCGLYPVVAENRESVNPIHRLTARVLDAAIGRIRTLHNNTGALTTLLAAALLVFFLLSIVASARRAAIAEAAHEVATNLRRQVHRQLYRLGQSSLPSEGTGPVMSLFTREVNDIRDGLAAELDRKSRIPVLVLGLLALGLAIDWASTIALASLGTLVYLVVRHLNRSAELVSVVATRESALQLCLLQEDFGLIRTVRVHGMENVDKQRFDEHLERHRDAEVRRMLHEDRTSPAATLLVCAAATLAVGLLARRVLGSNHSASSAFLQVLALLGVVRPSLEWLRLGRVIRQGRRSAEGVFAYLERKPELHQAGGAMFLSPLTDRISFENVTLENGAGRVLLDGFTAEVLAKTKTSIMSLDDEAKHALACLIPRLIDPKVGRVRIDGIDLRDVTLESVRAQVATVLQADLVFSDTVLANIALGDPSYDLPRVIEAAKVAHAHHFIQELPHGYDTVIGPLGEYLKPDQQYRIALARAFLHDPSIVIIEEPNVPLDDDTKSFVDDTIARLQPGRTLIMLPHRLSTIRSSDRVLVIHNGRLEAAGAPREISGDSKLYRHLQYIEFNQFAAGEIEAGQMGG